MVFTFFHPAGDSIAIHTVVPNAALRRANCYHSSSNVLSSTARIAVSGLRNIYQDYENRLLVSLG
jgi:hypothetical protein